MTHSTLKISDFLHESNWDAHDDSDGDAVPNPSSSAENIAKIIRPFFG
jgi:hypothetical protein